MDSPSDNDKSPVDETTHSSSSGQTDVEVASTHNITVTSGSFKAEIQVKLELSADGRTLNYTAVQYWANRSTYTAWGYLFVKFQSGGGWSPEINLDEVNINSQWTSINRGGSIASNGVNAKVEFRFLWRMAWGSGDPVEVTNSPTFNLVTTPTTPSINPLKNYIASTFNVTGTGAIARANMVLDSGGGTLAQQVQPTAGAWLVSLTVEDSKNAQNIQAYQVVNDRPSARTGFINAYRAKLTSPTNNSIMPAKDFKFTGIAAPNTSVKVVQGGSGAVWSGTVNTGATSSWQSAPLPAFSGSGEKYVTAELDGVQNYTAHITFRYLDYPAITNTELTVPQGFTITGRNRLSGATVTAYIGPTNTAVGSAAAATTDTFSITTTGLDPGAHALTLEQFHSSKGSGRGAAVTFSVRPNQPVVTSTTTGDTVTLHGTGFKGGKLHFHQPGNEHTELFSVDINSNGTFTYNVPPTQAPVSLHYSCRQSVAGVGSARVYSEGWVQCKATVPVPRFSDVKVSLEGGKLKFDATGKTWAGYVSGGAVFKGGVRDPDIGGANNPDNGVHWTITAKSAAAPGTYSQYTVRQIVNGMESADVNVPPIIVPSPPPVLTPITEPTGQRPQIRGTMWNGSLVKVSVNGGAAQTATTTGASFHLDATSDWPPATYTINVIAEFGGQTSTPSTQSLTVRTPRPKIESSGSVPLIATITGKGWPGCRVKIFTTTGNQELGADVVKPDGTFGIILLKQAAGDQTLYAQQYESGNPENASIESDRVTLEFGVPTAEVTVPGEGGRTARVSTFSGTTTAQSGTVELWLGNTMLRNNIAINAGIWSASGFKLDAGPKAVRVYIRDGDDLSAATIRNVKVVPEKLKIDSPLTNQNVGRQIRISGVGAFPGDQVIVRRLGAQHDFPPVTANAHGHWTTNVQHNMVVGNTLVAIARAGADLDSDVSDVIIPELLHAPQHFTQPQAGDRTGTQPVFAGLVRPRATVTVAQWFNSEIILATTFADDHGYFQVQSTVALAEGGAWVQMRDTLGGQHSEWRKSERFEVRPITAAPRPPTIQYPLMNAKVGQYMSLSGTALPYAQIEVIKRGLPDDVIATAMADRTGRWEALTTRQLQVSESPFMYHASQSRDGFDSGLGEPNRSVEIIQVADGFPGPTLDSPPNDADQILERSVLFKGKGFPRAEVTVYRNNAVEIYATARVKANGDWEARSVRLNVQNDARPARARQTIDGQTSALSDGPNLFKVGPQLAPPLITSFAAGDDVSRNLVVEGKAMPGATVNLYPNTITTPIGSGVANAAGGWTIKLYRLPPGEFTFAGKTLYDTAQSGWMPITKVNVHDFG